MRVKICGITRLDDALNAIEAGADALGFVFYPPSPRYITPRAARAIVDALPPFVERVGLFVEEDAATVNRICRQAGMGLAQIHWEAPEEFFAALEVKALKVVRVRTPDDLDRDARTVRLVDVHVPEFGGSGERLPLAWFEGRDCSRMILAGGLTPENVGQIGGLGFYGADVSSGVEAAKGIKDPDKVRSFIKHAKEQQ